MMNERIPFSPPTPLPLPPEKISTLVIATHNSGKLQEIKKLLKNIKTSIISAADVNIDEPEENGSSFIENAIIKSENAARLSGKPSLSDDSGLEVYELDGQPGIYSSRWAGENKDFARAANIIREKLENKGLVADGQRARFVCVLAFSFYDKEEKLQNTFFEGEVKGRLCFPPRGNKGFGYDPIFIPEGYEESFAEMDPSLKHSISHRADAFKKFVNYINNVA